MLAETLLAAAVLSPTEVNVVSVRQPAGGTIHLRAVLYSGSADDPPGKEGLASLTALAMAGGANSGGTETMAVVVGRDVTVFSANPRAEGFEAAYARWIRIFLQPDLETASLDALRDAGKARLETLRSDAEALAPEAFDAFAYSGHPYGHPAAGLTSGLDRISPADLHAFYKEHWRRGNLAVGFAGDLPAGLEARARADLEGLAEGQPARRPRHYSLLANPRVLIVELPSAQGVRVGAGHPISAVRAHPDHASLALALESLGGRLGEGMPRRQQAFAIWRVGADSEGAGLLEGILEGLGRLAASPSGLQPAAGFAKPPVVEEPLGASDALGAMLEDLLHGAAGARPLVDASMRAATAESVRSAAARHVHPGRLAIVAVAPDAAAFKRQLLAMAAGGHDAGAVRLAAESIEAVKAGDLFR